jgi:hypothetical protein
MTPDAAIEEKAFPLRLLVVERNYAAGIVPVRLTVIGIQERIGF